MSYILRSSLKYSFKQFGINYGNVTKKTLLNQSPACFNYIIKNYQSENYQNTVSSNDNLDRYIRKLDQNARKLGRVLLKEVEDVLEEIKSSRTASVTQSLMVIRCCGNLILEATPEKKTQLVQDMWNTFKNLGINLDISHYNALLRVYLENDYPFSPADILTELDKNGIEPNRVTYQRLIARYCQMGDLTGATRILEFMREKEMPVNETVFNSLVLGHSQANDMESAEGTLSVMKQSGLKPTAETYTILICGYIKQGNLEKMEELMKTCEKNDTNFIDKDYLEIIYNLAINGHEKHIDQILSKLRRGAGYFQDATNYIYKLVSANKPEIAFKILKTMARGTRIDGTLLPLGNFFVVHLIRCNTPTDEVIKFCDELMKENLNPQALSIAMESCLRPVKEKSALELFSAAEERNIPLRAHYFWPLLLARGKQNDKNGIFSILSQMYNNYGVVINADTIRDYVLPYVLKPDTNIESLIIDLKSCGISTATVTSSIVINLLEEPSNLQKATEIAVNYRAFYPPHLIRRPLVMSYMQTGDLKNFVTLLNQVCAGISWRSSLTHDQVKVPEKSEEDEPELPENKEYIGQIVIEVVKGLRNKSELNKLPRLLEELDKHNIAIGQKNADFIQNLLQDKLTPEISALLEKLVDNELSDVVPATGKSNRYKLGSLDEETLERLRDAMEAKGESTNAVKKNLFNVYCRLKKYDKLMALKDELEKEGFTFSVGMKANLIDVFVDQGRLTDALQLYNSLCEIYPEFNLNPLRQLKFAHLLIKNEQYDDAIQCLNRKDFKSNSSPPMVNEPLFNRSSAAFRLLNDLAEKGDVKRVHQFFDLITSKGFVEVNNILLGPLIKAYVLNNDLDGAMREFEKCCLKYRATPWRNELARLFIEKEDANNLQKLTDLSTQVHGEVNSLYDLMFTFLESGRLKQAKKILETPGLRLRADRLNNASEKYQYTGATDHLHNLIEITKDVSSFDRGNMYYNLLLTYSKTDDAARSLELWTQMQEEDVQPTDPFLILLADILNRNGISVPFEVPEYKKPIQVASTYKDKMKMSAISSELRKNINLGEIDKALEIKRKTKSDQLNITDLSLLLEALVRNNRITDALNIFKEVLAKNSLPYSRSSRYLLKRLMKDGNIEEMEEINNYLNKEAREILSFDNLLCRTYLNANRASEYISNLESSLESINNEEAFITFLKRFPKGGILSLMEYEPETFPQIKSFLEKLSKRNSDIILPSNILWIHYMKTGNFEEAKEIFKNKLQNCEEPVSFVSITGKAIRSVDLELAKNVFDMMKLKKNITKLGLGRLYSALIQIQIKLNQIEEAVKLVNEALKTVSVEHLRIPVLHTLKAACNYKEIPFEIDIKNQKKFDPGSDSDSDSDST